MPVVRIAGIMLAIACETCYFEVCGETKMATLQVRDIDSRLYEALRARAHADHRSVSQEVVSILEDHLSRTSPTSQRQTDLFLGLSGSWSGTETAEELVSSIKKRRKNSSRFGGKGVSFG